MNLVIDIGNTLVKAALFQEGEIKAQKTSANLDMVESMIGEVQGSLNAAIISAVRDIPQELAFLKNRDLFYLEASYATPTPVKNLYASPETLGMDRLAASIGGHHFFPGKQLLVISAGTCLTYDRVTEAGEYLGGAISPGMQMRFKALNTFTGRLPLVKAESQNVSLVGETTQKSILSGVINGMVAEIDGTIDQYKKQHKDIQIIFSGGDIFFFDKMLKNRIFAIENIVLHGLNQILEYNAQHHSN